jgi:hypothetical protein
MEGTSGAVESAPLRGGTQETALTHADSQKRKTAGRRSTRESEMDTSRQSRSERSSSDRAVPLGNSVQ